jgi:hypothetical protein
MNKYTLRQKIYRQLESTGLWTRAYDLEKVNTAWGWIGSSGSRRARELAEEGKIERRISQGYCEYRVIRKPK